MSHIALNQAELIERRIQTKNLHRLVKHNGVAYFAGIVADDWNVGMYEQTSNVCEKFERFLAEANSGPEEILSVQLFITDMDQKGDMDRAWLEWLDPRDFPARATVGVADLGDPRILIELVATAAC